MEREDRLSLWIEEYSTRLTQLANTYVRNWSSAEDVVQEAYVKAYRAMHQLHDIEHPFPWLVRIVINECRNHQRKRWREVVTTIFPERIAKSTEETYLENSEFQHVYEAILSLPEVYRTPMILFYFEDLSTQQIADILSTKPGTIRTRLARGREKLQKHLKRGDKGGHRNSNRNANSSFETSL